MSILKKIGFAREKLPGRISVGLVTSPQMTNYPKNPHTKYPAWVWCKDEFVPPLTKQEFQKYINNAQNFRKDFLKSLNMYLDFCSQIKKVIPKVKAFSSQE